MTWYRRMRIFLRLLFFVSAAGGLAWVSREGSSLALVGLVFVLYVAAATLWVRGQYQASVDAVHQGDDALRPWTFPFRISGSALGGGALLFLYGLLRDNGTALILGSIVAYLGSGYVLMRLRLYTGDGARKRVIGGLAVLAVATALPVLGLLLLEGSGRAALLIAAIGLAPIGLSLLAEPAIRTLQEPGRSGKLAVVAAVGAVVLLIDVGIALARADWWVAAALLGLALLVLAIVSSTQADIAVVIAAVSLMGVTSMSEGKPAALRPAPEQTRVLVALGDSYMSGEGADRYYLEDADDKRANHCHRAPTAWAAMAGKTRRLFDSVAFLACSGARTHNVRRSGRPPASPRPRPQYNEPGTQLDQAAALDLEPSLVVVSLGGNDAGFSTIGMMCLAPGDCSEKGALWEDNLPRVESALSATYDQIRAQFPGAPVVVTAYPAPISAHADCDEVALSSGDKRFVRRFVGKLNDTVERAATAKGFFFLAEMESALADAHLQLCDPLNNGRPGLNFIGLRSVGGLAEQRFNPGNWYHNSLHPNERGHAAMLQVFETWRAQEHDPPERGDSPPATAPPEPPCDLWKDDQSTRVQCVDEGAEWVRGQIRDTLLVPGLWGVQIAFVAAAAWLLAVALFGWWKPWWPPRPDDAG